MNKLNPFQRWQVDNGHHVTEDIDGDEVHVPELCPLCMCREAWMSSPETEDAR